MEHVTHLLLEGLSGDQLQKLVVRLLDYDPDRFLRELEHVLRNCERAVPGIDAKLHDEMRELCSDNKKVAAIKECRAATGWGLKESKDWVEANCY